MCLLQSLPNYLYHAPKIATIPSVMVQSCPVHLEADPNLDVSDEDQARSIPRGEPAWGGRSHGSSGEQKPGKATAQHASYAEASEQETSSESEERQEDQEETLTMAREEARMCEHFTRLALPYKSAYPGRIDSRAQSSDGIEAGTFR